MSIARSPSRNRGFTLIELVISLAIFSVLVTGLGSAMMIAARAMPDPNSPYSLTHDTHRIATDIAAELTYAVAITKSLTNEIEFTVNRNGASTTIHYVWSGTPGDPLQRQVDGGALTNVLDAVQAFALEYQTRPVTGLTPPVIEGPEILLDSHATAADSQEFHISANNWIGQYFQPVLAVNVVSWRVTRILFKARYRGPTNGQTLVQLRTADQNNTPTLLVLEQVTMLESDLSSSKTWQEFNYSAVAGLAPGSGLCLVLEWVSSSHSAVVEYGNDTGTGRVTTSDAGSVWNFDSARSLVFYAYGKAAIPDPSWVPPDELTSVRIMLDATVGGSVGVESVATILNTPEVSP